MKSGFLAGLTPREFMRRYWQKQPLLAPAALPEYAGRDRITKEELYTLAAREDVESRLIARRGAQWSVRHGPFTRAELTRMPRRNWTLLVQGIDQQLPQASRLLREFSFLPHARLDDVMVSYAAPGGGVGPHFDSYDVFLVQGSGERRWRIGSQPDLAFQPDLPLKILERFEPEREWTVQPGDVLYLPPQYAHDGVAIDECITYSVGFRAPGAGELASAFLDFLHDRLEVEGRYADPDVGPTREPGRLPRGIVDYAASVIDRLRWSRADVERFVGIYLTEPKNNVVFEPPRRPLSAPAFANRAQQRGVKLAGGTRMLVSNGDAYINGERHVPAKRDMARIEALADARELPPDFGGTSTVASLLYRWYAAGYIELAP
jgi:50S ribosomal protein L16 3-hydroxylase